jgi:AraC-like DNA-binding protein
MGRVRSKDSPQTVRGNVGVRFKKIYDELPYFDDLQIDSIKTLIEEIIFESAITIEVDETTDKIAEFLKENITKKFSIDELCSKFCVSKTNLYDGFFKSFGMTVNDYVIRERIERAKVLLKDTEKPVYQIGNEVGIDNYTYFCRLFKNSVGMSYKEYLKKLKLDYAMKLIHNTNFSITEIAEKCGYETQSHFNLEFKACFQQTPTSLRQKTIDEMGYKCYNIVIEYNYLLEVNDEYI